LNVVRVGIAGFGSMGRAHASNLAKVDGAELVAVCDIDEAALREAREVFKVPRLYGDWRDLVADPEVDAIIVCLPNRLHSVATIEALKEGKHVLCEKPPALTAKEVKEMFAASRRHGGKLLIGLSNRFRSKSLVMRRMVSNGVFGDVYYVKCWYLRRSGIPGMGSWFTRKKDAGAGALFDIGVHALDLGLWLMGDFRAERVLASTYAVFGPRGKGAGGWGKPVPGGIFDVEDFASSLIKMRSGATVLLEVSWAAHLPQTGFNVVLLGDEAGLDYGTATVYGEEDGVYYEKRLQIKDNNPYVDELRHFVDCIVNDMEPLTKPDEMVWLQAILEASLKSAESGEEVLVEA